ncbi:branched-chain amino acid ABC transporter substrate-binding protein [Bartonella henselae]|uniref:Branched chain aa ABC transporter, periplasmic aa-binding protein n=2 Tax=Bartonella TaxID=773 RepID=X5MHE1_BARHN|nr:ABC transporter substrate-binding protein [Bartonella henselae]MDM9996767.1 ABC transporter substrate-binding protein [Bartonella henselae]OLL49221.1 branched-chain amino acid ABC transporter substrate-binding protein [Bartonella henselae]OLL49385.1 branched-chain amino acid ABC transporter substrate-binding protein [Bartonella henselae]OLL50915.1 branched-chain amino acid ABC transporter substrate-binding protein [Bartonella henselae]OLL58287.1 branched-chain amino acid ABC transporter sub
MQLRKILAIVTAVMTLTVNVYANEPIKIGVYLPLSGQNAFGGQLEIRGIELAHKKIPEILGRKVELIVVDNKSDKVEAANAVMRLTASDKVNGIIGSYGSSLSLAGGEISEKAKTPTIATSSTSPLVTQGKKYYFRACFVDSYQGIGVATYAIQTLHAKKAAILKDISNDYAIGLASYFARSFKKLGGEIISNLNYNSGDQDFSAVLTQIIAQNPDILFIPSYFSEGAIIMKQARELGAKFRIMGGDAMDNPETITIAGKAAEGFLHTTLPYSEDMPNMSEAAKEFTKEWKAAYPDKEPNINSVLGYTSYMMFMKAIENAGSADREKITIELSKLKNFQTPFGDMSMDENHNPTIPIGVIEIKDGKRIYLDEVKPAF